MKNLRKKIIIGVFFSALAVFLLTIFFVGIAMNLQTTRNADGMTELIVKYHGNLPPKSEYEKLETEQKVRFYSYTEESPFRLRYFSVSYENSAAAADLTHIAAIDEDTAVSMAEQVKKSGRQTGRYDEGYRYRVSEDQKLVVFLDCTDDINDTKSLIIILALIALFFVLMITIVFYFLSNRIVKPFEENSRMQKQFITDASHELKTPLAIISANAEVLAYKNGENEWINNITTQVERVSGLVNELLTLNRLEEVEEISGVEPVDLSTLTARIINDFVQVFNSKNVTLLSEIDPNITINGNPDQLERLVSVLTENASKYVTKNGFVKITLKKDLRYTTLNIFNTCEIDNTVDYQHLFDRFYRPDSSRTSSVGGHGIGLSIAKRIAILHGGSIEAVPQDDGLYFNVKLSNKLK